MNQSTSTPVRKGLGRGLGSLIPTAPPPQAAAPQGAPAASAI